VLQDIQGTNKKYSSPGERVNGYTGVEWQNTFGWSIDRYYERIQ